MAIKKVLIIPSWYYTAEEPILGSFFLDQSIALKDAGADVSVVFAEMHSLRSFSLKKLNKIHFQTKFNIESGIPTYRLYSWRFPWIDKLQIMIWVHSVFRLAELYIKRCGLPDIIHVHSIMWAGLVAEKLYKKYNIPYVIMEHRGAFFQKDSNSKLQLKSWYFPYFSSILQHSEKIIAVSSSLALAIKNLFPNLQKAIEIIPNMVDTNLFQLPIKARSVIPFRFLAIANFIPSKGLDILIQAFSQLHKSESNILLEIIGKGELESDLKKLVSSLHLDEKIHFLGSKSHSEVSSIMKEANSLIVTSRWETFGVVIIEALATGIPVIATKCGGPEDILKSSRLGILVEIDNIEEMSNAMEKIMQYYQSYDPKHISQYVLDNYSPKVISQKIIDLYNTM